MSRDAAVREVLDFLPDGGGQNPSSGALREAEAIVDRVLAATRDDQMPVMALRRHDDGTMDDVVVKDVSMFRAEQLAKGLLWLCCYLPNGERITFDVQAKRGTIVYDVGEMPDNWVDLDSASPTQEKP